MRACGFNDVFFGVEAAEDVLRGQPGLFRDVDEVGDRRRCSNDLRLLHRKQWLKTSAYPKTSERKPRSQEKEKEI
jgi:hypothetical protein